MNTPLDDWDRDEREALEPLEGELRALSDRHASDPPFDLLRAASADALPPDLQASVAAHLADSRWSRALVEGAEAGDAGLPVADEDQLLARVLREAPSAKGPKRLGPRVWFSLVAASAVVVVAVALVTRSSETAIPPATEVSTQAPASAPAATRFQVRLDKPDVKLSPGALTYRGDAVGGDFLSQLKPALDAYRQSNYARADREFTVLAANYPKAVEVLFYQGIARLFLNDLAGADASLSAAERLNDASFAFDVAWYRAAVDERLGRVDGARARLRSLCSQGAHARQRIACETAERLK